MGVKIAVSTKSMNSPCFFFVLENAHETSLRPKKSVWGAQILKFEHFKAD